jgi:hypothetical protein
MVGKGVFHSLAVADIDLWTVVGMEGMLKLMDRVRRGVGYHIDLGEFHSLEAGVVGNSVFLDPSCSGTGRVCSPC